MYFHKRMIPFILLFLCSYAGLAQKLKTDVLWDTYGVPHVYAGNTADMYYAFGWAQMHNHANLLLQLYGQARGRSAEYWGEEHVSRDKLIHLFNIPELAKQQYARQKPDVKTYIDAFVKGLNAYATKHPEAIGPEQKQVLPVTTTDVMAHALRVLYLEFVASNEIRPLTVPADRGSNAIAIGPSRSADGNAMLLANPHLPWSDFFLFFEAHLNAPGYSAYGVTLLGMPVLAIAFNQHLGWTHTVNTIDAVDRYALKVADEHTYLLDNVKVPFKEKTVKLKVKQADGSLQEQVLTLKYARQGPVMSNKKNELYAIRIAGLDRPYMMEQWYEMGRASNRTEFEAALKMMQLPMFNVIYADDAGNISYLFAGNVPVRKAGDWQFWHTPVDGSNSAYIWDRTHPYEELPQLTNPNTGFLQNANDPPWTCTYPPVLNPAKYPPYMAHRVVQTRPQHALNMIRSDSSITYEELLAFKHNTRLETADRFLDDLLAAVEQHPDTAALRAAAVLKQWDRCADAASNGYILFTRWFDKLNKSMFATPFDPERPVETPDGLKDPAGAVKLLAAAAAEVQQQFGRLDEPWGNLARFRANGKDYPANGGNGYYGIFRVIDFAPDKDGRFTAEGGDSYVAAVSFGKKIKAQVLLSYGNATQRGSKHIGDQLELLAEKKLRTPWLEKEEIVKHLEEREVLGN
ncbi:MAG TPA: acylase [Chitinophaga sp.]